MERTETFVTFDNKVKNLKSDWPPNRFTLTDLNTKIEKEVYWPSRIGEVHRPSFVKALQVGAYVFHSSDELFMALDIDNEKVIDFSSVVKPGPQPLMVMSHGYGFCTHRKNSSFLDSVIGVVDGKPRALVLPEAINEAAIKTLKLRNGESLLFLGTKSNHIKKKSLLILNLHTWEAIDLDLTHIEPRFLVDVYELPDGSIHGIFAKFNGFKDIQLYGPLAGATP